MVKHISIIRIFMNIAAHRGQQPSAYGDPYHNYKPRSSRDPHLSMTGSTQIIFTSKATDRIPPRDINNDLGFYVSIIVIVTGYRAPETSEKRYPQEVSGTV